MLELTRNYRAENCAKATGRPGPDTGPAGSRGQAVRLPAGPARGSGGAEAEAATARPHPVVGPQEAERLLRLGAGAWARHRARLSGSRVTLRARRPLHWVRPRARPEPQLDATRRARAASESRHRAGPTRRADIGPGRLGGQHPAGPILRVAPGRARPCPTPTHAQARTHTSTRTHTGLLLLDRWPHFFLGDPGW
jgi:hypothetical protein